MAEANETQGRNLSVSVPITGIATLVVLAAGTAAYLMMGRQEDEEAPSTSKPKSKKNLRRRLGLLTVVTLIENDATRKVVVALLKAMAKRA